MKKLLIILDPAHGIEVPGKRSPDEKHREYKWSRERLTQIDILLKERGYTVVWTNTTDNEIGLSQRVNVANEYAKQYPELMPFLISLHNDAVNATPEWQTKASGISVWTTKGRTTSDIYADFLLQRIKVSIPNARIRTYDNKYLERDFEANFTVLTGNYSAVLIECMFQDNREDVKLLQDTQFCKHVEDWIVDSIDDCNHYISSK